jgi:hypothetical protein
MTTSRNRPFLFLAVIILLVSACTTSTPTESPTREESQPQAVTPSAEPENIQPPTEPAVLPEFSYDGHGQTLAMIQHLEDGNHRILLLDPFWLGIREIPLPEGARVPMFSLVGLAPDGAYYAYYTGSTETADLTLVLYDLNTESIATEIPLLSSDYPDNFQELADELIASGNIPRALGRFGPEEMAKELQNAFEYGIETMAWSPDGHYLAFSGQMEGPSSDLYVLDLETMEITRLTSGTSMMERIGWSPDGHWIRHASFYFVGAGYRVTNYAASRDGSEVISFPAEVGLGWGPWLTTDLYLAHESDNGPGMYDLMVMNASSGGVQTIFDGAFYDYALDPESNTILLQSYHFFDDDPQEGLYRIQASEPYTVTPLSNSGLRYFEYIGLEGFPFIGTPFEQGTVLIRSDGSMEPISNQYLSWEPAPDPRMLALYSPQGNDRLWIYYSNWDQHLDVYSGSVQWVRWGPDSDILIYSTNQELHAYTLYNSEDSLIYTWSDSPVAYNEVTWVTLP